MKTFWTSVLVFASAATLPATQYSYSNSGGTVSMTDTTLTISGVTMSNPAGTVSMTCNLTPVVQQFFTEEWSCTGGTFSVQSTDGKTSATGTFATGLFTLLETEINRVYYYTYTLFANFSASQTINGKSIAVAGAVTETLPTMTTPLNPGTGTIQTGLIDTSPQYAPVYIADTGNNRIVRTADVLGSNWTSIGQLGSGVEQFSAPWGVALDAAGKIYVSDSGNCRIVRMDNMTGTNWTAYGTCGAGAGQFSNPEGLWVDASGKIYVADTGNNRVVRMDDITGTNFTSLGKLGNGAAQFSSPAAVTTDAAGNIYVADNANARVVEFSDMLGTNWAVWQFPLNYLTPDGVAVDSAGKVYTTDSLQSQVIRADNISGANEVSLNVNGLPYDGVEAPSGIFVYPDGTIYIADTKNNRVDRLFSMTYENETLLGTAGTGVGNLSLPHAVVAQQVLKRVAESAVTPPSLRFPTELVGAASPTETTMLSNIGSAPFTVASVTSTLADFPITQNCPSTLLAGQSCSATVTFQPAEGGLRKGSVEFQLTGATSKSTALSGSGALVTLSTNSLIMFACASGTVTVTNPLSSSTSLNSVKVTRPFRQTNNCGTLDSGASCTITVNWCSATPITGTLFVTDASGTTQYVTMTGEQ
ncbi:MAG TPA: choice-of-anchor D domain-containing protein [Bryobacteraceae bacterium]|jgi:streptogramin lyase|nr:choice-of-anchor D domain-containing protein [Bryobacteraceae bacterium]